MKLRQGDPWMTAKEYSQTLRGLSLNLLVRDIGRALVFQRAVIGAEVVYSDPDFAVCSAFGSEWMFHADHTYDRHPMGASASSVTRRGAGVELRVHGRDPDEAVAAARRLGLTVLSAATDKGHGTREAHIEDQDGYVWVPDVLT